MALEHYTRFSERVFVPDKKARSLLKLFCTEGIPEDKFLELNELVSANSPSMLPLLRYLQNIIDFSLPTVKCPSEWTQFIRALASPSPVCGLVHPSENLFRILRRIPQEDITRDLSGMSILQTELPVLFDLLGCVTHFPVQSMSPLLKKMIEKSMAPFAIEPSQSKLEKTDHISGNVLCELSYFPCLPKVRVRGLYHVDSSSRGAAGCTKQSGGHPTLLPGIFTVYCPHGELTAQSRLHVGHVKKT